VQRGEHPDGRVQGSDDIDDRDARLRRDVGRTSDAHQPADRLHERVVAGHLPAAALAEAADLAVDDAGADGRDRLVVEPEPLERPRLEVGDDHVGALAETPRKLEIEADLQVESDRALVAIRCVMVRGATLRVGGREPAARVVAGRRLDLDHIRAQVAQGHRDERAREHAGEVDDGDPLERGHNV